MAQRPTSDFNIDPNITSGTDLSNILNRFQDAVDSGNSGTSRPAYLDAGGMWVKTGNPMRLYLYDGTNDNELYNTTDGIVDGSQWQDSGNDIYYNDGNVGIGTDAPTAYSGYTGLTIEGSSGADLSIRRGSTTVGTIYAVRDINELALVAPAADGRIQLYTTQYATPAMTIDALGRSGIGGYPSRSAKEIEEEAASTLANWVSKDKKPTKAELIKRLTERNIGGGDAILQVLGDGYFSGDVYANGSPLTRTSDLIETLSTLREATQDETTLEGLRDSIGNAIGGLIEKFEAMQSAATQEIKS